MKILQITPSLNNAGAERFIVDLSNQLSKLNNHVTLISLVGNLKDLHLFNEIENSINVIQFDKPKGFSLSVYNKLNRFIIKNDFDIIHTHTRALNYISPLTFLKSKTKFVHTIHNDAKKETKLKVLRFYKKLLFNFSVVYPVSISKNSHKSTLSEYGLNSILIENGSRKIIKTLKYSKVLNNVLSLKPNDETKVFLNIARISEQKNQKLLINVFRKLEQDSINVILLIIGSVKQKHVYDSLMLDLPSNVFLLGEINNATDYLFLSDVFCLSSLWEGMPISLLESFNVGCFPICTPAGGITNMIKDGENGLLANDFSEESFYLKVLEYLSMQAHEKSTIKSNCINVFSTFYSMEMCSKRYLEYYNKLIKNAISS